MDLASPCGTRSTPPRRLDRDRWRAGWRPGDGGARRRGRRVLRLRAGGDDAGRVRGARTRRNPGRAHPHRALRLRDCRNGVAGACRRGHVRRERPARPAQPGQTILQAGLEAGLDLPYSCTMGGCGACTVKKSGGEVVTSEPNCLGDREREEGYILACCSYADGEVTIDEPLNRTHRNRHQRDHPPMLPDRALDSMPSPAARRIRDVFDAMKIAARVENKKVLVWISHRLWRAASCFKEGKRGEPVGMRASHDAYFDFRYQRRLPRDVRPVPARRAEPMGRRPAARLVHRRGPDQSRAPGVPARARAL